MSNFAPNTVDESNWNDLTGFIAKAQDHVVEIQKKEVARDIVSVEICTYNPGVFFSSINTIPIKTFLIACSLC